MALMATTSLAAQGRPEVALAEHEAIANAIAARDPRAAADALRLHLREAYKTRLRSETTER